MSRLSAATLDDARSVQVPTYDRSGPAPIVHLGLGAFARAHLAVYADDLLRAGHPATIRAVSLRRPDMEEQLGPQDGLFTVTTREPATPSELRLVASVTSVATGAAAAIRAIAEPTTTLVTLTVTEQGYEAGDSTSPPGVVAAGLAARRRAGGPGVVVASLDNVSDNGAVLRHRVLEAADGLAPGLPAWIEAHVAFPRSVVDRMVPATTAADRAEVRGRLGLDDASAVVAEAHRSWVMEAVELPEGTPLLARAGVQVVADIGMHQQRKLWLLNGPHSALAYGGLLAGHTNIAEAAGDVEVLGFVRRLVDDVIEVLEVVAPDDHGAAAYAGSSLRRFGNAALGHTCAQVGADGSQKLAQRVFPVVQARRERGWDCGRFAVVVAIWLVAVTGVPVGGRVLASLADPRADELGEAMRAGGPQAAVDRLLSGGLAPWLPEVVAAFERVAAEGARALVGST